MSAHFDVAVIGAGSNGLAAATVLARAGKNVVVLESAVDIGGQARVEEFAPGFSSSLRVFDTGWIPPSVASATGVRPPAHSAPAVAASLFRAGERDWFTISSRAGEAEKQISQRSTADARRWRDFVTLLRTQSALLEQLYQHPSPRIDMPVDRHLLPLLGIAARTRLGAHGAERLIDLLRTMPMSIRDLLDDWFSDETLKAVVAAGAVHGARQGPYSGGTVFSLIHGLAGATSESIRGRPYLIAGPDAFASALVDAARGSGAQIRLSSRVERVLVDDYQVRGVLLISGEELRCSTVISTADPRQTMLQLVEPEWLDPEVRRQVDCIRMRGHTAMLNYALASLPAPLGDAGNLEALKAVILLTPSVAAMEKAYDAVKYGELAQAPHIEVTLPSARWPGFAPQGSHVLTARVTFVPFGVERSFLAAQVDRTLEAAFPGFLSAVRERLVLTPADIADRYNLSGGCLSQGELTLDQILFMRPIAALSTYRSGVGGLWLGGAGSHPGPGVLGGAGVLAAKGVLKSR